MVGDWLALGPEAGGLVAPDDSVLVEAGTVTAG
jgi:hypothetical protein